MARAHKLHVFVTRSIPTDGLALLKKNKRLALSIYDKDTRIPRKELLKRVRGADVILSILTEHIDKEVMDAAGDQLKLIANYAVGFDNVDLKEAEKRGITVTNAPAPEVSESVAEHTIALIFALSHRLIEGYQYAMAGKYKAWGPKLLLGSDVKGKTIGIIGTGHIGSTVVERLYDGFGLKILYNDVRKSPELEKRTKAKFRTLPQLLKEADIVSLHVPLLPSTRHLISTRELSLMKKTAFLINTSRGPVVDEKALYRALKSGKIGGAGIDVFECEPHIDCDPTDSLDPKELPTLILTPHTASATLETRQAMSVAAAKNILAFAAGKKPPNRVK